MALLRSTAPVYYVLPQTTMYSYRVVLCTATVTEVLLPRVAHSNPEPLFPYLACLTVAHPRAPSCCSTLPAACLLSHLPSRQAHSQPLTEYAAPTTAFFPPCCSTDFRPDGCLIAGVFSPEPCLIGVRIPYKAGLAIRLPFTCLGDEGCTESSPLRSLVIVRNGKAQLWV